MSDLALSTSSLILIVKTWLTGNSPNVTSIHILDDDVLLNVIYLYRPVHIDQYVDDNAPLAEGWRWWYKLAHVCQRWRNLILRSASYLGLCLVCTYGTPVADMLAHSPPLPLIVDYSAHRAMLKTIYLTAEENGMILALKQRNRICRVRLKVPSQNLRKVVKVIDEEYPILEYLYLSPLVTDATTFKLPERFQAPRLRHLVLLNFTLSIGSRLLTTTTSIVTFWFSTWEPCTYFEPNVLLEWISFMPQLHTLRIDFMGRHTGRNRLTQTPVVTLPNLRLFRFRGFSTYMEKLVRLIITPRLENISVDFIEEFTSIPSLSQLINTAENLKFDSAYLMFSRNHVWMTGYLRGETERSFGLTIGIPCSPLDSPSVAQLFNSISQRFSAVEHLALESSFRGHNRLCEYCDEVRAEWRRLLRPFNNVKTLHIYYGLVEALSRCLQREDGEHPLELLPKLQELTCYDGSHANDEALASFIYARQIAGHPIILVCPDSRTTTPVIHSESQFGVINLTRGR